MGQKLFRQKYDAASSYQGDDNYSEETFRELMDLTRLELPSYAEEALQADNEDLYRELNSDIEQSQWFEKSFPASTFSLLLSVFQDKRFLKAKNGWILLMLFESEWEKVTEEQKTALLDVLAQTYEKFEDWMPRFSISELVGEKYPPEQVLIFFGRLADSPHESSRLFVPHGYEHALRNSSDINLTASLWSSLLALEQEEPEKVRGEVETSLARLAYHGFQRPIA